MKTLEINWKLNNYCEYRCDYCPSRWSGGELIRTTEQYLEVIEKLQITRYHHSDQIKWIIGGGEPLSFPNINQILRKIKEKNSYIKLDTSGGDSWFNLIEIIDYVDYFNITHHYWQNASVLDFIIDNCNENNKKLKITVPLLPGKILESREIVADLVKQNIHAVEQILRKTNGGFLSTYSSKDKNLIRYLPEDYAEPVEISIPYVPLNEAPTDDSPSYTGKTCYAGIDTLQIDHKGFASGSECGSRYIGNVFDPQWEAPNEPFACPMLWCRSENDRNNIRVN
jgi:MoaA/NifB/PqqE/SkfB family radical SAM enzyme